MTKMICFQDIFKRMVESPMKLWFLVIRYLSMCISFPFNMFFSKNVPPNANCLIRYNLNRCIFLSILYHWSHLMSCPTPPRMWMNISDLPIPDFKCILCESYIKFVDDRFIKFPVHKVSYVVHKASRATSSPVLHHRPVSHHLPFPMRHTLAPI